jgi:hypothetical protein
MKFMLSWVTKRLPWCNTTSACTRDSKYNIIISSWEQSRTWLTSNSPAIFQFRTQHEIPTYNLQKSREYVYIWIFVADERNQVSICVHFFELILRILYFLIHWWTYYLLTTETSLSQPRQQLLFQQCWFVSLWISQRRMQTLRRINNDFKSDFPCKIYLLKTIQSKRPQNYLPFLASI